MLQLVPLPGYGRMRGAEFVPFLQFDREIRTIICSTNAIESVNARIRGPLSDRAGGAQMRLFGAHEP
jgi:hypothetical protein